MQMNHFREILILLSLKYIPCSLKRRIVHVCILNGYKVMQFWHLKGPFYTTAIIYRIRRYPVQFFSFDSVSLILY